VGIIGQMRTYRLILLFLVIGCHQKSDDVGQNKEQTFDYEINLNVRPSFSPHISYTIRKSDDKCSINNIDHYFDKKNVLLTEYFTELEDVIFENFYKKEYKEDHGMWTDGTPVTITVALNDSTREFAFDNSGKNSLLNKFVPPIYNIIHYLNASEDSKFKLTAEELDAFEQSEQTVVDFPIRKISEEPLKYRLYGRVYTCCYEEVQGLFNSFPRDKVTSVEVSRFYTINSHDEFYVVLRDDISKRENVRWIVSEHQIEELTALGIPRKNIIQIQSKLLPQQ
jgi:hypothetical protein